MQDNKIPEISNPPRVGKIFSHHLLFAGTLTLSQPTVVIPWSWLFTGESI